MVGTPKLLAAEIQRIASWLEKLCIPFPPPEPFESSLVGNATSKVTQHAVYDPEESVTSSAAGRSNGNDGANAASAPTNSVAGRKKIKCTKCKLQFDHKKDFKDHKKGFEPPLGCPCPHCGQKFKTMNRHKCQSNKNDEKAKDKADKQPRPRDENDETPDPKRPRPSYSRCLFK